MEERDGFAKRAFRISVVNRQSGTDLSDTIEETAECSYRCAEGRFYITYGSGGSKVMLRFADGTAELMRTGGFGSKMVYIPGRETEFDYRTPYGSIAMKIKTDCVRYSLDENGGIAELEYLLYAGGDKISNKMTIRIER